MNSLLIPKTLSIRNEAIEAFKRVYNKHSTKIDSIFFDGESRASAYYKIHLDRTGNIIETQPYGYLEVTNQHTEGHFNQTSGLPEVFPGYLMIETILQILGQGEASLLNASNIKFLKIVQPGDILQVDIVNNIIVLINESTKEIVAEIEELVLEYNHERQFPETTLIESAAQSLGLLWMNSKPDTNLTPLFKGFTSIKFWRYVESGQEVKIEVELISISNLGFKGNAVFKIHDETIGEILGIECIFLKKALIQRILKIQKDFESEF